MKGWTQHQARGKQLVEADQFNAQHQAFRGQAVGLDRAQMPAACLSQSQLAVGALHRVVVVAPWDTGVDGALGEQTAYRSTSVSTEQFQGLTYQDYGSGWVTAYEHVIDNFQGGSLLVDWCGCTTVQPYFTWTWHARQTSTPAGRQVDRHLGVRILFNGVVAAERLGPAKPMDSFRLVAESKMPAGNMTVTFQFRASAAGPDDALEDTSGTHLLQAHLWGCRAHFVGRWR